MAWKFQNKNLIQEFLRKAKERGFEVYVVENVSQIKSLLQNTCKSGLAISPELKEFGFCGVVPQSVEEVKTYKVSFTKALMGVAETGTLIFRAYKKSPRCLTLLPETIFVLIEEQDIKPDFREAFRVLKTLGILNFYFISGPSSTADIEKVLIKGVHGPRNVKVLVLKGTLQYL